MLVVVASNPDVQGEGWFGKSGQTRTRGGGVVWKSEILPDVLIVESLSALPRCLQKFLRFPRFFAPGYSFWRRTRIHRDPGLKIFFRRAVHVQSFQSPCTCTARPALPSDFIPLDRPNQELNNAFLDESLAQKEPKLWSFKVLTFLRISRYFRTDYAYLLYILSPYRAGTVASNRANFACGIWQELHVFHTWWRANLVEIHKIFEVWYLNTVRGTI